MIASFLCAVVRPAKNQQMLTDLTWDNAKKYNETMYLRYEKLKSTNSDTCYLDSLTNVPRTIVATDVGKAEVGQNTGLIFCKSDKAIFR